MNFYFIACMHECMQAYIHAVHTLFDKVGWKCNPKTLGWTPRLLHKIHLITNNDNYIHYSTKNRQLRTVCTVYVATLDGNN